MTKLNGWNFQPERDYGEDWHAYFSDYTSQRNTRIAELSADKTVHDTVSVIIPGHEVPLETVVKRNKDGSWSQQSSIGKMVLYIQGHGGEVKAGSCTYTRQGTERTDLWIMGVVHRRLIKVQDSTVWVNNRKTDVKGALALLAELEEK